MPATATDRGWWRATVALWLLAIPAEAWPGSNGQLPGAASPGHHADPAVHRALALLPDGVGVPVVVIDTARLDRPLRRAVGRACTFIRTGEARIYVVSTCAAYLHAERSRLDAMKLAALIRHEQAHLLGADEARARFVEARAFRELLRDAPAEYQTPGVAYAAALERHAAAIAGRSSF